jgi:hypothetical protein
VRRRGLGNAEEHGGAACRRVVHAHSVTKIHFWGRGVAWVHDDGVGGPSGTDDGAARVIEAEVVKEAGYALGDGAQDGARRDVPNDDFGSEEKADIK